MADDQLNAVIFRWNNYSIPSGVTVDSCGHLFIEVESAEHLDALVTLFAEIHAVLLTTRNRYKFRRDPDDR